MTWIITANITFIEKMGLFVCFKGGMGTGAGPGSPLLPDERVRICRDPQSREFPLHHYSGLGTGTEKWVFVTV